MIGRAISRQFFAMDRRYKNLPKEPRRDGFAIFAPKTFLMDISPPELADLQQLAQKVARGSELEEVTINYLEDGIGKTATITHPILLQLMKMALLEVNRKHGG